MANSKSSAKKDTKATASILTSKELTAVKKFRKGFPPSIIIGIPVPEFWYGHRLSAAQLKQLKTLNAEVKKYAKALDNSLKKVEKLAVKKFEVK